MSETLSSGKMTNEETFARAAEHMQKERSIFLSRFERLSQAQLDFKPSRESWSVGETAQHVALTEQVIRDNIQTLLQQSANRQDILRKVAFSELPLAPKFIPPALFEFPPFLMSMSLMSRFVPRPVQTFFLANPLLKARAAKNVEPQGAMMKDALLEFLHGVRRSTLSLLEGSKSRDLSRIRWEHPLMGTHDIYETMELLTGHEQRHGMQIDRVKNNPRFPAR